jgi:hypothetical protein
VVIWHPLMLGFHRVWGCHIDIHSKPTHAVTSIKQSPVLKILMSHFYCFIIETFIRIQPLLRGHLSHKVTFSLFKRWPLNAGWTVCDFFFIASVFNTADNFNRLSIPTGKRQSHGILMILWTRWHISYRDRSPGNQTFGTALRIISEIIDQQKIPHISLWHSVVPNLKFNVLLKKTYCILCVHIVECQLPAAGLWFSPGTPISSTNKTDRHDIAEILLKVLNC